MLNVLLSYFDDGRYKSFNVQLTTIPRIGEVVTIDSRSLKMLVTGKVSFVQHDIKDDYMAYEHSISIGLDDVLIKQWPSSDY